MTDREDFNDVVENPECCVLSDLAETFLLGGRLPLNGDDIPCASLFWSTFLLLGENCADFISVGVPTLEEPGRDRKSVV